MDAGGFWQAFTSWLGGFINWWNTLGAGNLAEAGAAAGTVAALFWMASAHAREMRRNRVAEGMASIESERRAAKERKGRVVAISFMLERTENNRALLTVANDSAFPIFGVKLIVPKAQDDPLPLHASPDCQHIFWGASVVAAGRHTENLINSFGRPGGSWDNIHLLFRDVEGNWWRLAFSGQLVQVESGHSLDEDYDHRILLLQWENRPLGERIWLTLTGRRPLSVGGSAKARN